MRRRSRQLAAVGLMGALLLPMVGCDSSSDLRASVEGTVTLDGDPLDRARIKFVPIDGAEGPVAGGRIKKGKYIVEHEEGPTIGKNRVEINATRTTGKKVKSPMGDRMVDETTEGIPARYNSDSTLECEIRAGRNRIDFELSSDG